MPAFGKDMGCVRSIFHTISLRDIVTSESLDDRGLVSLWHEGRVLSDTSHVTTVLLILKRLLAMTIIIYARHFQRFHLRIASLVHYMRTEQASPRLNHFTFIVHEGLCWVIVSSGRQDRVPLRIRLQA